MASSSNNCGAKNTAGLNIRAIRRPIRPIYSQQNCVICLGRFKGKCFAEPCMHSFCFKCLYKWSKKKPECPLCKQPFKIIIHNVRTMSDYDCYHVPRFPRFLQLPAVGYSSRGNGGSGGSGSNGGSGGNGGNGGSGGSRDIGGSSSSGDNRRQRRRRQQRWNQQQRRQRERVLRIRIHLQRQRRRQQQQRRRTNQNNSN